MNRTITTVGAAAAALLVAASLAGCAQNGGASDGRVSITVGNMPTAEQPQERAAFERAIEEFEAANPDIDVQGDEAVWNASTFQALVAGGQLPTVFDVPFTEMQGLIERQQVLDISDAVGADSLVRKINPAVLKVATGPNGELYGIPNTAYSMGLLYNRALFQQAGLNPDDPPTTWDEVRTAAQAIQAKTKAQGMLVMTTSGTGGWVLNTMTYAFGGRLESEDGKTATVDNSATKNVLEYYRKLRWDDDVLGSNFLVNWGDVMNNFAAGTVGMVVQGADAYPQVVVNRGMDPQAFGLAPLPQTADGLGTLGGGTVSTVSPRATPEQAAAAAKWVEYRYFHRYVDKDAAVAGAEADAKDGLAVAAPGLPLFDRATDRTYLSWIADYVNVPRDNYKTYFESAETLPLVPEPAAKAQEVYKLMDTVVQAVLTRQDADIDALLADAKKQAQAVLDAG